MNFSNLAPIASSLLVLTVTADALLAQSSWSVDPSGGGSHTTIQGAIDTASTGDHIVVFPGRYNEVIDFGGKGLIIESAAGADATVIDGTGFGFAVVHAASGEPPSTTIRGFSITGGAGRPFSSSYGSDYYGGGVFVGSGSQLLVESCWILDNGIGQGTFAGGVYSGNPGSHVTLLRCLIAGNTAWASGGATLVDHSGRMTIDRCTVFGNTSTNFLGHQGGIAMANGGQVTVRDSIVWGNSGAQIASFGGSYGSGTAAAVTYCCVQEGFAGAGNIASDPLFVDAASRDFQLLTGSPCIDAGDPSSPADPDGSRADMGTFPFPAASTARYTTFGASCTSAVGLPVMTCVVRPIIGVDFELRVEGVSPHKLGFLLFGFDDDVWGVNPLPLDLGAIGAPGCFVNIDPAIHFVVPSDAVGVARAVYPVPAVAQSVGTTFYNQFVSIDDAPPDRALRIAVTNGGEGIVGW